MYLAYNIYNIYVYIMCTSFIHMSYITRCRHVYLIVDIFLFEHVNLHVIGDVIIFEYIQLLKRSINIVHVNVYDMYT